MRFRTLLAVIVACAACAFFIINWQVFAAPAKFNLIVTSFETPVGVAMLGVFAISILTLAIYFGIWQSSLLLEYRRQAKELESQRTLADNAEASRFTEMGALLRNEIANLTLRLDTTLEALREDFRHTENSIAATLGEMDDRMQRSTRAASGHESP
jgi:uncharacterized integral membrane protein